MSEFIEELVKTATKALPATYAEEIDIEKLIRAIFARAAELGPSAEMIEEGFNPEQQQPYTGRRGDYSVADKARDVFRAMCLSASKQT